MRKYETIVVFHPHLSDTEVAQQVEGVKKILLEQGALELEVVDWGKREIAYLVQKQKYGYYKLFAFECDNHQFAEVLNSLLRINEKVLKFQTHRLSEHKRKFKGNPARVGRAAEESDYGDDLDYY